MTLLFVAIPVALLIAAVAVAAFIWAARTDQYEDLDTPPLRMLMDDAPVKARNAAADSQVGSPSRNEPADAASRRPA